MFVLLCIMYMETKYATGCLVEDPTTIPWLHRAEIKAKKILPSKVDLSKFMPPVGNQDGQGSCVAWAVGYYHKTFQEWLEHRWDVTSPYHQFSPAFIYNQINGGVDGGSYISDALKCLCDLGCANLVLSPYDPYDSTTWPSEEAYDSAIKYRSDSAYYLYCGDTAGIRMIKQLLYDSITVIIAIAVYYNYLYIENYDTMYCVADSAGELYGWHAQCIVGYDDNKPTHDGVGAFRVVNSWGTDWGNNGYYWMSYEAVMRPSFCWCYAYYSTDKINYSPMVKSRIRIIHPSRYTVGISLGAGESTSPVWEKNYFDWYMPRRADWPFPSHKIVLDLTDGADFISRGTNIFLRCVDEVIDAYTGSVDTFLVQHLEWAVTVASQQTPAPITDGGTAYVNVILPGTAYYSISGYVKRWDDTPADSIMMVLTGYVNETLYTDSSGYYEFDSLLSGKNYILTPYKESWIFDPDCREYNTLSASQTEQNFTGYTDIYEPNNTIAQAYGPLLKDTLYYSFIWSADDTDWYYFELPESAFYSIDVILTSLPADYDLFLYDENGQMIASSENSGFHYERIEMDTLTGKKYIKIIGKNGAYHQKDTYLLKVSWSFLALNEEIIKHKVLIYPNPAHGEIKIFASPGMRYEIYDISGRLIEKGFSKINAKNLSPGIYFIRIGNSKRLHKIILLK